MNPLFLFPSAQKSAFWERRRIWNIENGGDGGNNSPEEDPKNTEKRLANLRNQVGNPPQNPETKPSNTKEKTSDSAGILTPQTAKEFGEKLTKPQQKAVIDEAQKEVASGKSPRLGDAIAALFAAIESLFQSSGTNPVSVNSPKIQSPDTKIQNRKIDVGGEITAEDLKLLQTRTLDNANGQKLEATGTPVKKMMVALAKAFPTARFNSTTRPQDYNTNVVYKGKETDSDHQYGLAFDAIGADFNAMKNFIDQNFSPNVFTLIHGGHLHVSFRPGGQKVSDKNLRYKDDEALVKNHIDRYLAQRGIV